MNKKQRTVLEAVFEKPTRVDIKWNDIESLFRTLKAEITEGKGSRVRVALNGRRATFHRPHRNRVTGKYAVEDVRLFLTNAGARP